MRTAAEVLADRPTALSVLQARPDLAQRIAALAVRASNPEGHNQWTDQPKRYAYHSPYRPVLSVSHYLPKDWEFHGEVKDAGSHRYFSVAKPLPFKTEENLQLEPLDPKHPKNVQKEYEKFHSKLIEAYLEKGVLQLGREDGQKLIVSETIGDDKDSFRITRFLADGTPAGHETFGDFGNVTSYLFGHPEYEVHASGTSAGAQLGWDHRHYTQDAVQAAHFEEAKHLRDENGRWTHVASRSKFLKPRHHKQIEEAVQKLKDRGLWLGDEVHIGYSTSPGAAASYHARNQRWFKTPDNWVDSPAYINISHHLDEEPVVTFAHEYGHHLDSEIALANGASLRSSKTRTWADENLADHPELKWWKGYRTGHPERELFATEFARYAVTGKSKDERLQKLFDQLSRSGGDIRKTDFFKPKEPEVHASTPQTNHAHSVVQDEAQAEYEEGLKKAKEKKSKAALLLLLLSLGTRAYLKAYTALARLENVPLGPNLQREAVRFAKGRKRFLKPFVNHLHTALGGPEASPTLSSPDLPADLQRRVQVIAATEAQAVYGQAQLRVLQRAGYTTKNWVTVGDDRVRESHVKCEAQRDIPLGDRFANGLLYPGDPAGGPEEVCNCRCWLEGGSKKPR